MTIDERLEQKLTARGVDVESDEGAYEFQQELERILEKERRKGQQMPQRQVEKLHGIMV